MSLASLCKLRHRLTPCSDASPMLSYSMMALYRVLSRWDARTTLGVSGGTSATPVQKTLCSTLICARWGLSLSSTSDRVTVSSARHRSRGHKQKNVKLWWCHEIKPHIKPHWWSRTVQNNICAEFELSRSQQQLAKMGRSRFFKTLLFCTTAHLTAAALNWCFQNERS